MKVTIERIVRVACLEEIDALDREDLEKTSAEERIAVVERLRQTWFQDFAPERRLERVLACADLDGNPVPLDRRTRAGRPRGATIHRGPRRIRTAIAAKRKKASEALVEFGFGSVMPEAAELAKP